jgi:PIN domain nuclease of toxin-antitoxin system
MLNLDTHILLFALNGDLSSKETKLLSAQPWSISAIVLWEISKLVELGRVELELDSPDFVKATSRLQIWPITLEICRAIHSLDFDSDPADELIAATSLVHRVPLITRDRRLLSSKKIPFPR